MLLLLAYAEMAHHLVELIQLKCVLRSEDGFHTPPHASSRLGPEAADHDDWYHPVEEQDLTGSPPGGVMSVTYSKLDYF